VSIEEEEKIDHKGFQTKEEEVRKNKRASFPPFLQLSKNQKPYK